MECCSPFLINRHRYRIVPHHFKLFLVITTLLLTLYSGAVSASSNSAEIVFVKQIQAANFSGKNPQHIIIEEKAATLVSSVKIISEKKEPPKATATPVVSPEKLNTKEESVNKDNNEEKTETNSSGNSFLAALNAYRQKNGKASLLWDGKLADYAQSRAELFSKQNALDSHTGFNEFIKNQDGFNKLGFNSLGENSGIGHNLEPATLIENAYGKSPSHDDNQLNSGWSHVGIGVSGTATNFIFGGSAN